MALTSTTTSISLGDANIPASGSCTITATVLSATVGTYMDSSVANALSTAPAGGNVGSREREPEVAPSSRGGGGGARLVGSSDCCGPLAACETSRPALATAARGNSRVDKPSDSPPSDRADIEPLQAHHDARGSLFEPLDDRELASQKNVHVVLTEPGGVRGNHFHRTSVEMTAVVGPCLVRLKELQQMRDIEVPAGEIWRFTIPPRGRARLSQYRRGSDGPRVLQHGSA